MVYNGVQHGQFKMGGSWLPLGVFMLNTIGQNQMLPSD